MKRLGSALFLFVFLLLPSLAFAQTQRNPCYYTSANPGPGNGCIPVSSATPLPVAATATIGGGFTDAATGTPISVTTGGVTGTLPAGTVVTAFNVGTTNTAYCKLGASSTVNDIAIPPASWFAFQAGANTQLTCITSASTTTVNMIGGSGLPTGSGGGGGGSGGGGAITAASSSYAAGAFSAGAGVDGWDLTQGAKADAAWVSGSGSVVAILKNIAGSAASSIPAGTALIGKVGIDQTTPGTTNGVQDAATGATGSTVPTKALLNGVVDQVGGNLAALEGDPCQTTAKTTIPITLASAAVKVIVTGVSAKKIYVCHIDINNNAADSIAIFEATTATTCATSAVAVVGAGTSVASAATGYNFSANGGISLGAGGNQVLQTSVNNNDLCVAQSAATQLTGSITFATR